MIDVILTNPAGVLPVETQHMLTQEGTEVYLGQSAEGNSPPPPPR